MFSMHLWFTLAPLALLSLILTGFLLAPPPLTLSVFSVKISKETGLWPHVPGRVIALPIQAPGSVVR